MMGEYLEDLLKRLRDHGWRVAQHYDTRDTRVPGGGTAGGIWTYWLFMHREGVVVSGGGTTDCEAVRQAISEAEERHPELIGA